MLDDESSQPLQRDMQAVDGKKNRGYRRQPRPVHFRKEAELAKQRKEEQVAQHNAFEEANREREAKRIEGDKFRKAMLRAKRGGKSGNQRRLGRESQVLLEKVQRIVQG